MITSSQSKELDSINRATTGLEIKKDGLPVGETHLAAGRIERSCFISSF